MARKKAALDFEQSLADLQTLVERLENGELSLEDSLTAFEQGIGLTRDCQAALAQAEQKVQVLLERDGEHRQDHADLLKERCGWARFTRYSRCNKVNPAHAKRPLQFARYECAEKSGACCGERALPGSRCAADQQRFATSDVQAVSA